MAKAAKSIVPALLLLAGASAGALDRIRGVNIGGWLVLERWIKPSIFREGWDDDGWRFSAFNENATAADQWQFCSMLGKEECKKRLDAHWDSWVTYEDVQALHDAGITHMRVPIGYWMFGDIQGDEPYVDGDFPYLLRLCDWAREHSMQVWVDLHAAPGSQNGFDNSGHYGVSTWANNTVHIDRSVGFLHEFSKQVAERNYTDIITGVGLLNEPDPYTLLETLTGYYQRGFQAVRKHLPTAAVFVGDMFAPADFNWFWAYGYPPVDEHSELSKSSEHDTNPLSVKTAGRAFLDTHIYHVFTESLRRLPADGQIEQVCKNERDWIDSCCWQEGKPTALGRIIGEWTAAFDRRPSEQWEATTLEDLSEERKDFIGKFVEAQMTVYEQPVTVKPKTGKILTQEVTGWFFWNFKMELAHYREWDYLEGLRQGWIPKLPNMANDSRVAADLLGSCESINEHVANNMGKYADVVMPFPNDTVSDDHKAKAHSMSPSDNDKGTNHHIYKYIIAVAAVVCVAAIAYGAYRTGILSGGRRGYEPIGDEDSGNAGSGEIRLSV